MYIIRLIDTKGVKAPDIQITGRDIPPEVVADVLKKYISHLKHIYEQHGRGAKIEITYDEITYDEEMGTEG